MTINFTEAELIALVTAWMWPFTRIAGVVATAPVFGNRLVPVRVKLALALGLTLVIAPVVPPMPAVDPLSGTGAAILAHELLIGVAIGFSLRLVFAVLEVAGQQIAQLMGLGFASMVDPNSGADTPLISQVYVVLGTLVFLSVDGHLALVQTLASSFVWLPVSTDGAMIDGFRALSVDVGWIFEAALAIALPAMAALLTVNLAFGVVTKTAPQLNIFAVGFPVTIVFGVVLMALTLTQSLGDIRPLIERSLEHVTLALTGRA